MTGTDLIAQLRAFPVVVLGAPLLVLLVLAMVVLPLPPIVLDLLFTFNITLSLIVILAVIYVARPLDFGVFPTVLLVATLLRLALNIASTRVVLLQGHTGTDAAGRVIEAFGDFVIGGNYAVGIVVFAILVVINFVVVTKGATRVSEVSARFTLDAMPGKQMAIDADLNAGILNQEEARERREEVRQEGDFYGAMDGASKFVRGDAIAGILILVINLVGGLLIGVFQHGLPFGQAVEVYALLTVGDGLVAQIPSLLLSTSVAIIVTRMSRSQDMGSVVLSQVFGDPRVLALAAGLLALMGVVPGMPNLAFLSLALVVGSAAWWRRKQQIELQQRDERSVSEAIEQPAATPAELDWDDVAQVDPIGLEVGYRLVPLVDQRQGGELIARVKGVRRKLSQQLGFLIPAVHIRDNLQLSPGSYRLLIFGVPVAEAEVHPDRELAINPGGVNSPIQGIQTADPAFGMPAVWIEPSSREYAQTIGFTVADAATVIATHISQVMQKHAHELLGHQGVHQLLEMLAKTDPRLVEELTPKTVPLATLARILQGLLAEKVPIRNLRSICETVLEHGMRTQDPEILLAEARVALGRQIVQEISAGQTPLPVITLAPELEEMLQDLVKKGIGGVLEPGLAERMQSSLQETARGQEARGEPAVLLVPPSIRSLMARFVRQAAAGLHVLGHNEIPEDKPLRLVGSVAR